jgi:hypothetical protein
MDMEGMTIRIACSRVRQIGFRRARIKMTRFAFAQEGSSDGLEVSEA